MDLQYLLWPCGLRERGEQGEYAHRRGPGPNESMSLGAFINLLRHVLLGFLKV